jgi:aminoglycoside phosphotransferase (APT) family kinase protein
VPGDRLLHLDLHPGNVILTADGPCVIDWSSVARGAAGADLAHTWLVLASTNDSGLDGGPAAALVGLALAREFHRRVDGQDLDASLPAVAERRLADDHVRPGERANIRRLLRAVERPRRPH